MELDVVDLFGDREAESAGDSAGESDTEQQQQQPNFLEEGNNDGQGEEDAGVCVYINIYIHFTIYIVQARFNVLIHPIIVLLY